MLYNLIAYVLKGIKFVFFALVFILALYLLFFFWTLKQSKPQTTGMRMLPGLEKQVKIARDNYGVVHVLAENEHDMYYAFGYAQAQDRFFQMDLSRRLVEGRLSELVGAKTLKLDEMNRMRGLNRTAEGIMRNLTDGAVVKMMQAFADGVNARLAEGHVAPEYALLLAVPDRWRAVDTVAVALAMADNLVGGYEREIQRAELAEALTPKQLDEFFPSYPNWAPRTLREEDLPYQLQKHLFFGQPDSASTRPGLSVGPIDGSNSWVLSGAATVNAFPILANDPHLSLMSPSPFYLARLSAPGIELAGAVLPGEPAIVIGRNENLAWTNTTNPVDAEDLLSIPKDEGPAKTEINEVINVRSKLFLETHQKLHVLTTDVGPILDADLFGLPAAYRKEGEYTVLKSAVLDQKNGFVQAIYDMNRARSVEEFIAAAQPWSAPMTNVLVASKRGDIALLETGHLPWRDKDGKWIGTIPWAEQPNVINPNSGVLSTANNMIVPDSYKYPLTGTYTVYRQARIQELLLQRGSVDLASAQHMQTDTFSYAVKRILPSLLKNAKPQSDLASEALDLLKKWDGNMLAQKPEPLIYSAWLRELSHDIYADELGEKLFQKFQGPRSDFIDEVLNGPLSRWCDNENTAQVVETCDDLKGPALDRAVARLSQEEGRNISMWQWGHQHQAVFKHPLLTPVPLLGKMFTVRTPVGGDTDTVFPVAYHYQSGFDGDHGPGMRVVFDFSDLQKSQFVVAPGQSAHPWSPHFKDLVNLWKEGKGFEIRTDWKSDKIPTGYEVLNLYPRNEKQ